MTAEEARAEPPQARLIAAGDTGLVVEFGDTAGIAISERVLALQQRLGEAAPGGVVETVATFRSLMIHLDPEALTLAELEAAVAPLLEGLAGVRPQARHWRLPVCYEPGFGPDLEDVARETGLEPEAVVERHAGLEHHVYMIGFLPGYPYLGDLPDELRLPRRPDPRQRIPTGSVAIATAFTGIYPVVSPGGWWLLGRTPIRLFDPAREAPALLAPSDKVRFEPVSADAFAAIEAEVGAGRFDFGSLRSDA